MWRDGDCIFSGQSLYLVHVLPSQTDDRLALRTGAARIALESLAAGADITLVPTGLHYYDVSVLRGRCFIDIGPTFTCSAAVAAARAGSTHDLGDPDAANHALVKAVTQIFAERLGAVADEYDGWEQRRRFEVAATAYLRAYNPLARAGTSYEEVSTIAGRIARAPAPVRERVDIDVRALDAELEILGLSPDRLNEASLVGPALARGNGKGWQVEAGGA